MADLDAELSLSGGTMCEELLTDVIFATNSDKTITEAEDSGDQDLEGFCEQVHTHLDDLEDEEAAVPDAATFNESGAGVQRLNQSEGKMQPTQSTLMDSPDIASPPFGGAPGQQQRLRSSDGSTSERQQKQRREVSEAVAAMPKVGWVRGDAGEEESSLGLSEMRIASLSQSSPAPDGENEDEDEREGNGLKVGRVVDWRIRSSPIRRPGHGSGASLCFRGSQSVNRQGKAMTSPLSTSRTSSTASKAFTCLLSEPTKNPQGRKGKKGRRGATGVSGELSPASRNKVRSSSSPYPPSIFSTSTFGVPEDKTTTDVEIYLRAGDKDGEQDEVMERMGKVKGTSKGKGKAKYDSSARLATMREVGATDKLIATSPNSNGWIQRRNSAFEGGWCGGHGDEDGERDDRGTRGASSTTSQNILAIGVPDDRRVSGPPPRDPAPSAAYEGPSSEDSGEEYDVEGVGEKEEHELENLVATPAVLDTQDINPDNSSQVLKDCSQQKRKTDRNLDEAIAAAEREAASAGEVIGDVYPSSPVGKDGAVNGNYVPATRERSLSFEHGSHEFGGASSECPRARKTDKRKDTRPGAPAVTIRGKGTPIGTTGERGRMVSRTPSAYLGSTSSKSSTKKSKNLLSPPLAGANRPPNIFDMPSEEEEVDGADVSAAALRQTSAERRPCAVQGAPKSVSSPRKGKCKGKKASKIEALERSRAKVHPSGYRSREGSLESNGNGSRSGAMADEDRGESFAPEERPGGSEPDTAASPGNAQFDPVDHSRDENGTPRGAGAKRQDGDTSAGSPASSLKASRVVSYHHLSEYLRKEEGWKQVAGRGLVSWIWIVPGSQKGKKGEAGVDFVTNEGLVDFACRDKGLLGRFWAFRSESDEEATATTRTRKGDSNGGAGIHDAGQEAWTVGSDAPDRGAGESCAGIESGRGKSSPGVGSIDGRQAISKKRVGGRDRFRHRVEIGGRSLSKHVENELSRGRLVAEIYKEIWPKLQKQGWRWVRGTGLVTHVWLKDGVSKRNGTRGVNMFESMDEVVEHVLGVEKMTGWDNGGQWQHYKILDGKPVLEEWGLAKFRSKRQRFQRNFLGVNPVYTEKESDTEEGAPAATDLSSSVNGGSEAAVATANGKQGLGKQTSGPCQRESIEAGNISPLADGGTARGNAPAAPAPVKKRRGRPPTLSSKRRYVERDDFSRRALRDGGCNEQRDMMNNGIADVTAVANNKEEVEDDLDAATQPQFELSTAMNMIEAKHRAHAATTLTTVTRAVEVVGGNSDPTGVPSGTELLLAAAGRAAISPEGAPEAGPRMAALSPTKTMPTASSERSGCSPGKSMAGSDSPGSCSRATGIASPSAGSPAAVPGSGAGNKKRGGSPGIAIASRALSARRPLAGLGFIVTGIRSDGSGKTRQEIEASIKTLGGTVVDVFDTKSPVNADWVDWLLRQGGSGADGGGAMPPRADERRRMIAVSAPDGDRLPKVQVALASRMPIVHPSYVTACVKLLHFVSVSHYLLPYGRSALGDHGLVMPGSDGAINVDANYDGQGGGFSSRDRPFRGKKILYYAGGAGDSSKKLDTWEFALRVAGATVITVVGGGPGGGRKADRGSMAATRGGSRCTLDEALGLLERGQVDCLIGPNNDRSQAVRRLDAAARGVGTMAGTVEWASQCLIHARLLVPHVGTCPWFPLIPAGDDGGCEAGSGKLVGEDEIEEDASGRSSGKGTACKGRTRGGSRSRRGSAGCGSSGGGNSEGGGSGGEIALFYVHSGSKRFVVGDYAFVRKGKGEATSRAPAGGRGGANGSVADLPRVVRILSFERGRDGKVTAKVMTMNRCDGRPGVLVEGAPSRLPEAALDSRVLVMSQQQMFATQVYSLGDEGILCLDDQVA